MSGINIVPTIEQPNLINIPLFLHQLKSIEDMHDLEKNKEVDLNGGMYVSTKLGVLGDLPGYGKTLSMLGLISISKDDRIDEDYVIEKNRYHDYVSFKKVEIIPQLKCSLILSNLSLISQWIIELNRTSLSYIAVYKLSDIENIDFSKYDVVLVSSNIFNIFAQVYKRKSWKRFIIDEPASLKLSMEEVYANFYWLITGTPNELYLKRLSGFLKDLIPEDIDTFSCILVKNDDDIVKNSYRMPHTRNIHYKYKDNISSLFESLVPDNVIEMIQSNNISGVFDAFGVDDKDNFYISIYDAFKNKKYKRLEELNLDKNKNFEKIQVLENHLKTLDDRITKSIITNNCMSCSSTVKSPHVVSCCQRIFCGECISSFCLFCKSKEYNIIKLELKNKEYNESNEYKEENNKPKLKMDIIMDIIGDCVNKKILIFSNYNETFSIIKRFLDDKKLTYLELKGTKEKRDNTLDSYKSGNVNILLLNTIHSGAGLDLQETSDIILCHKLHEYQKIQVMGRANRIGRKIELNVHYLD